MERGSADEPITAGGSTPAPVIQAGGVTKTYGETVALEAVSLTVDRGEVFGLIGPNGAGKTTLVRALTGTTVPDEGSVRILGTEPTAVDRNRLAVLPQDFSPPDRLTAQELLTYYAGLYDEARDPDAVLEDVGMAEAADTWYENLSGGQQRRVCVGAAIVNGPDLLFLDEPTTGIDPAGRRTVWGLLEELAASGTTIVLTTHDMAEAERLADRVGLLANGSLVAEGTPADLIAEHGGSSRLAVEIEVTEAIHTAEDTLEGGGYNIERVPPGVAVSDVSPTEIGTVVTALEDAGVVYTGLEWSQPGLEDVYLSLASDVEGGTGGLAEAVRNRSLERLATAGGDQ